MLPTEAKRRIIDLTEEGNTPRQLDVVEAGPPAGPLLVFHSGTPSGPALFGPLAEAAAEAGYRYLNYGRPGYGRSTPQSGRSVADCAADTLALVDRLGGGEFVTVGWSGGGPHALACGALAPDRCRAVAVIAGVAPRQAAGLDWYDGMGKENIEEFGLAERRDPSFESWLEGAAAVMSAVRRDEIAAAFGDLISEKDKTALEGSVGEYLEASLRTAFEVSVAGWRDDDFAFLSDWGFSPSDCGVSSLLVQGSEDRMVPRPHGEHLASELPEARYLAIEGEGHLSVWTAASSDIVDFLVG